MIIAFVCAGCGDFGVKNVKDTEISEMEILCPYCKTETDWVKLGEMGSRRAHRFIAHGLDINGKCT